MDKQTQFDEAAVLRVLDAFQDPETGRSIVKMDQVRDIKVSGAAVRFTLRLSSLMAPLWDEIRQECEDRLRAEVPGIQEVQIDLAEHELPATPCSDFQLRIKKLIAVGSGKGGVGKSTVASLLAVALSKAGSKVGLLDADIYGPSIPHLLGAVDRPVAMDDRIRPVDACGIRVLSMGMLMPGGEAVMWRGPMLHAALTQFFRDTEWGELDYLIIDMPPGTGDVPLSLATLVPLAGAVVVCTPQPVALIDAVRAITMFRRADIRVLGMIENMSAFVCPGCGERHEIFGSGGAARKAEELRIPVLGEIPVNITMRTSGDRGLMCDVVDDPSVKEDVETMCRRLVRVFADEARAAPPMPKLNIL